MTMITPSYLGETIEYSSLHACRSTLEDPTDLMEVKGVGEKLFVVLRPHLSTSGPTTLAAKIKSTGMRKGRTKSSKTA